MKFQLVLLISLSAVSIKASYFENIPFDIQDKVLKEKDRLEAIDPIRQQRAAIRRQQRTQRKAIKQKYGDYLESRKQQNTNIQQEGGDDAVLQVVTNVPKRYLDIMRNNYRAKSNAIQHTRDVSQAFQHPATQSYAYQNDENRPENILFWCQRNKVRWLMKQ